MLILLKVHQNKGEENFKIVGRKFCQKKEILGVRKETNFFDSGNASSYKSVRSEKNTIISLYVLQLTGTDRDKANILANV